MDPVLTVVIPTRDRPETLARTLRALLAQTLPTGRYEVLVVDDGSRASVRPAIDQLPRERHAEVHYIRSIPAGPAAARNVGIRRARSPLLLFLGDDIVARDRLLEEHVCWHLRNPDPCVAVLGHVTWSPELTITPYMRWLESSGHQFDYQSIQACDEVDPRRHFYTANVSLKREFIMRAREFFDETFEHAAFEDIELGIRLAACGLVLKYNQHAAAFHHHETSVASALRRARRCGESSVVFERKTRAIARQAGLAYRLRIGRNLAWCGWRMVANWPFQWLARACESYVEAPRIYARANTCATHTGILAYHLRRRGREARLP